MFSSQAQLIIMVVFGCMFAGIGIAVRFGFWKSWYWRNARMVHGYIPLGILIILFGFNDAAKGKLGTSYVIYQGITITTFLIGVWWSLRPPLFIIPKWVKWVEAHPRKVVMAMVRAARTGRDWKTKVQSKKTVDAWAKSIKKSLPKTS